MASKQMKTVVISLMCVLAIGQPVEETLDWDDFEAALVEDGSDEGISLLQSKVNVKFTSLPKQDSLTDLESKADSSGAMDDISPDAFAETMSEEKVPEAVSLMQTEAQYVHRSASPHSVPTAMVANADGSVVAETKNIVPQDGIIHMSVGVDGSFTWEGATEGLSLIQQEATMTTGSKKEDESAKEVESVKDIPSEALEHDKSEGVVLLQTDAHKQSMVTKADGSIVKESQSMPLPEDGMVQLAIDADGSSEAVSLIQTKFSLKTSKRESEAQRTLKVSKENQRQEDGSSMTDISADSFEEALKSSEKGTEAVSLLQTDAHVVHKTSTKTSMVAEADGSIGFEREITKPHDGIVHMSVGAHGTLQWEI